MEEVKSVLGRIRDQQGRMLLLKRRSDDRSFTGYCFPGGKVDGDEDPAAALRREIGEEIGARVVEMTLVCVERSPLPRRDRVYVIHCFEVRIGDDEIRLSDEHESFVWASREEARELPLAGVVTRKLVLGGEGGDA